MTHDQESALLLRWRNRADPQAFRALVDAYLALVYNAAARILGAGADAEDVTQEAFLKLAQAKRIDQSIPAWLHRVATNTAISQYRSKCRRQAREQRWSAERPAQESPQWDDIKHILDQSIDALPTSQRAVIIGHFFQGKTHDTLAQEQGVTRTAITKRITRATNRLRKELKQSGVPIAAPALITLLPKHANAIKTPPHLITNIAKIALVGPIAARPSTAPRSPLAKLTAITAFGIAALLITLAFLNNPSQRPTDQLAPTQPQAQSDPEFIATPDDIAHVDAENPEAVTAVQTRLPDSEPETFPTETRGAIQVRVSTQQHTRRDGYTHTDFLAAPNVPIAMSKIPDGATVSSQRASDGMAIAMLPRDQTGDAERIRISGTWIPAGVAQDRTVQNIQLAGPEEIQISYESVQGEFALTRKGATSNKDGTLTIENLEPGTYAIATEATDEYSASQVKTVVISAEGPPETIDFYVTHYGAMEGLVTLNGEPAPNAAFSLILYPSSSRKSVTTDDQGRYYATGLIPFEGNARGALQLDDGTTRLSLYMPATVKSGETTQLDFDIAAGTARIEGRVYRVSDGAPLECGLNLLWQYTDGEAANRDRVQIRTDPDGYFRAENLLPGSVLVEAFAGFGNSLKHRKRIEIAEGETARVDFPFDETYITVHVSNIPEYAQTQAVLALPPDFEVPSPMTTWEQQMQVEDNTLCVGFINNGIGELNGLPPGRYTIVASALPTGPYFQHFAAAGDEFLNKSRRVSTQIELPPDTPTLTLHLDFED